MIRVTLITKHPVLAKPLTVGHIDIVNDQTGTDVLSNHEVHLFRRAKDKPEPEHFRSGRLENFDRGEHGYYDLLHQSLNATAETGFGETAKVQQRIQVNIDQIPHGTGKPTPEGRITIERQKGGSDTAARFKIDFYASEAGAANLKVYRSGQLRNFDTTQSGGFDLLLACMNATVKDGFFRRSKS